jgi:hypothetical protein
MLLTDPRPNRTCRSLQVQDSCGSDDRISDHFHRITGRIHAKNAGAVQRESLLDHDQQSVLRMSSGRALVLTFLCRSLLLDCQNGFLDRPQIFHN